jgi:hypothetical protein
MQESIPAGGAEVPGPSEQVEPSTPGRPNAALADPRALPILTAEHSSLAASRSLTYNESFSRAGMFLTFLSATLIVIGFVVGAQGLTGTVVPIALALLVADLYIGAATLGRIIAASREELHCVRGMNRIRNAYREMVPGLEPYFTTGFHDDAHGVLATYGGLDGPSTRLGDLLHGLTTAPGMLATIEAMIAGAILAIGALGLGANAAVALVASIAGFVATFVVFLFAGYRLAWANQARVESRFPSPRQRTPQ